MNRIKVRKPKLNKESEIRPIVIRVFSDEAYEYFKKLIDNGK